jgi:hypothetical protein
MIFGFRKGTGIFKKETASFKISMLYVVDICILRNQKACSWSGRVGAALSVQLESPLSAIALCATVCSVT